MNPRDFSASFGMRPEEYTDDLLEQLNQSARANGFKDFAELQRKLESRGVDLDHETKYQLLKRLAPLQHEAEQVQKELPPVDCTGLTRLNDLVQTVARMIVILLFGYTEEQLKELADRMKAERALEIDNALNQKREELLHSEKVQQLAAFSQILAQPKTNRRAAP